MYRPRQKNVAWANNSVCLGMTFAAACGYEVPEGYQHSFCIPSMMYAGAPPCWTGHQHLCDIGNQMSGLSLREYFNDVNNTIESCSAGQTREERQVLQLVLPSDVAANTKTNITNGKWKLPPPNKQSRWKTHVTEKTIAQVCQSIVYNTALASSITTSSQAIVREPKSLVTSTHLMPRMSRYCPIPKGHQLQIIPSLLAPFTSESQSDISSIT